MPRLAAILLGVCVLCPPSAAHAVHPKVLEAEQRRIELIEDLAPSVVSIFARGGGGGGSGVLISPDGYALSNFHVTSSAGNFMKCGLNDGVLYDAVIVGVDPTGDVALIKLLGRDDFPHATLGDSDTVEVGDWAYAMGNPFMLATDFRPTVTYGIVSGVHRYQYPAGTILEYTDCIQVDASINPGNSGGPLFDEGGKLVGINGRASFEKRGRVNSGAGYAISINQIKHFLDHLKSGRIVDHATLGATVRSRYDGAVVVDRILEESEAFRRGLREGDEIVSFAGRPVRSVNQFKNILGIYPQGWERSLEYRRDQQKHRITVELRPLHRESELQPSLQPRRPRPGQPPERPDEKEPDDEGPQPQPEKRGGFHARKPEVPEKYKEVYTRKRGFANYYFNKQQQQRVLEGLRSLGNFSDLGGVWKLAGTTEDGRAFTFTLADDGLGLELPDDAVFQPLGDDATFEDKPQGTGGLLAALHHLRLLLTREPKVFTEFYYLGSEPLDGQGERVDVLVSLLTGVESHWYFSRTDGAFVGFDTRLRENADECEVRFRDFGEFAGRRFPAEFVVRHAGTEYATFRIDRAEMATGQTGE